MGGGKPATHLFGFDVGESATHLLGCDVGELLVDGGEA